MSLLSENRNYLQELINAGEDAMTNLYYVEFSGYGFNKLNANGTSTTDADHSMFTVRCQGFSGVPAPKHTTATVNFLTDSIDLPTSSFDLTKSINFTFRLDANYELYRRLLLAEKRILNANNSTATAYAAEDNAVKDTGFTVKVYIASSSDPDAETATYGSLATDNSEGWKKVYEFKHCWISKLTAPKFDYNSNSAQTVGVSLFFYDMEGPNF